MSGIRATIDDIEVPIDQGDIPAFSFSVLDLEDPDKLKGSSSTTFKMPATREVRAVLGGPGMSETVTNTRPRLRIGNEGQVLYESKVVPIERSSEGYSVVAVGDNAEWFELAKATKLRDIDMGTSATITDQLMRDSWVDDEQPLTFPVIDFGSFENRAANYNVTVNKLRPAIRLHTFLRRAFADWGFALRPMGSLQTLWKKLIVPNTFGDIKIGENFLRNSRMVAYETGSPSYSTLGVDTEFTFNTAVFDPSGTYTGVGRYTSPFTLNAAVVLHYDLSATIVNNQPFIPGTMTVQFQLYNFTSGQILSTVQFQMSSLQNTAVNVVNFGIHEMFNGHVFGIRVRLTSLNTSIHVLTVNPQTYIQYLPDTLEYQEGVTINVADQAPDMTVMDVLKAIAGNRCLLVQTNTAHGEVKLWLDSEFYRGMDQGIDWTARITHNPPPVKEVPLYPRRIEYRWKDDDNDRDLQRLADTLDDPGYGNYDKAMPDGTKDPIEVSMPFAPTAMGALFDGNIFVPVSRKEDGTYQTDDYDREKRLLIMQGLAPGAWTFDGNAETQYPMCYFINPSGMWTLAFGSGEVYGDLKLGTGELDWSERQRRMMTPRLHADVMIWPDEIWNLDQGVPRLVNDGYDDVWVYPVEINQYVFTQPEFTECVLIPL